jgi:predicted SAM-dependent methyltransferase
VDLRGSLKRFPWLVRFVRRLRRARSVQYRLYAPVARRRYLRRHTTRKLQLGTGGSHMPGWLSTDREPIDRTIVYQNVTRRFPFADATFDFVFSEHLIEHLSYRHGRHLLRECHRVMKPGATMRIATPDLEVILGLCSPQRNAMQDRYIRWITDRYLDGTRYHPTLVINNAFRNWGHQFLYDAELLSRILAEAGFVGIRRVGIGESADPNLRGLESHGANVGDEDINRFETMVFEADRPG